MMSENYEFKRKVDYSEDTKAEIKCLCNKFKDLLIIPNEKCFIAYYKGITIVEKITDSSFKVKGCQSESKGDKSKRNSDKKYFIENYSSLKSSYLDKMPKDRERRTSQVIALNNMSFADDAFSVCGWETTISTLDVKIPEKKGGPEIDLVVVNPEQKRIIFVEYKCVGESMLKGNQNIANHYRDYMALKNSKASKKIKEELLKSFELMYEIKKGEEKTLEPYDEYEIEIGFLFVDDASIDGRKALITEDEYEEALSNFKAVFDDEELLYIRARTVGDVDFNAWKKTKESHLAVTCK